MALQDDRTFVRHFSWVILFLAAMLIIFIILSFVIVGATGVESHSGYSYVQYMNQHQAAAPAATASGHAQAATAQGGEPGQKVAANETAQSASGAGAQGGAIDGESVWKAHCSICHATGVAGAPKIGDKADWAQIVKTTDQATLYKHAIDGCQGDRGFMPPRGGAAGLSDAQVKAAVDYMIKKSGWSAH